MIRQAPFLAMPARRVFIEFGIGVGDLDRTAAPIVRPGVELNEDLGPLPFQVARDTRAAARLGVRRL